MFQQKISNIIHHRVHLGGGCSIAQPEQVMEPKLIAGRVCFDAHGCDLAVGNAHYGSVESADADGAEANLFDRADRVAHFQEVSHSYDLVEDQRNAANDVLQRLLRGEGNRDAADTESSQSSGDLYTEEVQNYEHACEDKQYVDDPAAESQYGSSRREVSFLEKTLKISLGTTVQQDQNPHDRSDCHDCRCAGPEKARQ